MSSTGQNASDEHRRTLLKLLATHSYEYSERELVLASGKRSHEYVNCKVALSRSEALPALGRTFLDALDIRAVAVGGLTMGADPIAIATAHEAAGARPLRWFSVRKEPKPHGLRRIIEGDIPDGAQVTVVDDVVTTGGSTIQAIDKCRSEGLRVIQVLVLVDREEEGGLDRIRASAGPDVAVRAIFTKSEVRREWELLRTRSTGVGTNTTA
ncbi:MAG TPA: orotate phosphoribosyltransferase [Polyangiaceae bacterium]|nr:orotate phosphoribosyltransferase [Polyangiaceae bacterium]